MARKTREEAVATREALLDAAQREFRDKGVAHTTLADVAHAAGLTRGAIYWHFRDKAELFEAMCERAAMPMEAMLGCAGGGRCADPLGTLRTMAVMGLTRLASDARTQAVFDVMYHKCEFTADLAPVALRQRAADEGCRRQVIELLDQAVARGQLPADADTGLAAALLKGFHGRRDARMGAGPVRVRSRAHGAGADRHRAGRARRPSAATRAPSQGRAAGRAHAAAT